MNEPYKQIDSPYNADDPAQVNAARKKAGRKRKTREDFVTGMMSLKEGRAYVYTLLSECGTFASPFNADPYTTAFFCGKQHIGHLLLADIMKVAPEMYHKMVREAGED